jgi:hypothetical protein
MRRTIQVATLAAAALAAYGQAPPDRDGNQTGVVWGPPKVELFEAQPRPTVPKEMIGGLSIAGWPIVLEDTELIATRKHFGGTLGSRGDAGEALAWLCLYRRDKGASWVLWLESFEIDGPTIGGFRWQQLDNNSKMDERCQPLRGNDSSLNLPLALCLGMKEADVVATLGQPSKRSGNTVIYVHEHDLTIRSEPYTVSNDVIITYRAGRIWAVEVTHSTVS